MKPSDIAQILSFTLLVAVGTVALTAAELQVLTPKGILLMMILGSLAGIASFMIRASGE